MTEPGTRARSGRGNGNDSGNGNGNDNTIGVGRSSREKRRLQNKNNDGIKIACILDLTNFYWAETIFEVTIDLLRDPRNGFYDEIFDPSWSSVTEDTPFSFEILDGACDGLTALSSYWKTKPVQALIGARCSGASIPLAWMGMLDNFPQISASSTSAKL